VVGISPLMWSLYESSGARSSGRETTYCLMNCQGESWEKTTNWSEDASGAILGGLKAGNSQNRGLAMREKEGKINLLPPHQSTAPNTSRENTGQVNKMKWALYGYAVSEEGPAEGSLMLSLSPKVHK